MTGADAVAALQDPATLAAAALAALALILVWRAAAAAANAARAIAPLARQMEGLATRVDGLAQGQERLTGGLTHVSERQAQAQGAMLDMMERRLAEVQAKMGDSLSGSAQRTAQSLGALSARLATIDRAQARIEQLSGDVLSLQDILSNKQTRGAFGEIQLADIVGKALPPDAFSLQATLPNGTRTDCLIHLPRPPGPIAVDSKFPLEAYEALRRDGGARGPSAAPQAARAFRLAVRRHIRAIAERYILEGHTAEGALMFLPSEAVYAELHASFPELVRESFEARVWIVSPTTCMATLNTLRAVLKDARLRAQAGAIRHELGALQSDLQRLVARVEALDTHFERARRDLDAVRLSAEKAGRRARRLEDVDFSADDPAPAAPSHAPVDP